jgi:hypothetical protein
MKKDEARAKAIESATEAEGTRHFNSMEADQVAALKSIAWAITYLADVLRYKIDESLLQDISGEAGR